MSTNYPFRLRQDLLAPAESVFYQALREVLRDQLVAELLMIWPKVSLLDVITVARPNENVQHFNRLLRKSVDFLLVHRPTLLPAIAIELEYPKQAHHRTDRFLDELFKTAGLPFLRIMVQEKYQNSTLAAQIKQALPQLSQYPQSNEEHFSPICPHCGITMVLRFYRSGPNVGKRYYGCLNYPDCREIIPLA